MDKTHMVTPSVQGGGIDPEAPWEEVRLYDMMLVARLHDMILVAHNTQNRQEGHEFDV